MSLRPVEGHLRLTGEQAEEVIAALADCQMGATTQAHFKEQAQAGEQVCYQYATKLDGELVRLILLPDLILLQPSDRPDLEPRLAPTRARLAELSLRFGLLPFHGRRDPRQRLSGLAED